MATLLTPGLYFERVDSGRKRLPAVRTDVAAFVGVAARGPLNTPTPIYSWAQFEAQFGGFLDGPFLAYSVKAFFENGGVECHVVRVAAGVVSTALDTAAAQPSDRSYSVAQSTDGFVAGAVVSASQDPGLEQDLLLSGVDPLARRLIWNNPLSPAFDLTNPIQFSTGASAASGVLLDGAGQPTLQVSAQSPGAWGNQISVSVAQTNRAATKTLAGVVQTTAASRVETVVGFAEHALVKVFQDQSPAPALVAWHTVASVDGAAKRLVWDVPLEPGYILTNPIYFETIEFSLGVSQRGTLRETYEGLSLVPESANYVPNATQSSNYIRVQDLQSPSPFPARLPVPANATLVAGRDGTAALQAEDFTGDPASDQRLGLRALELDLGVFSVAIPDILMQAVPPVEFAPLPPPTPNPCLPCGIPQPTLIQQSSIQEQIPCFSLADIARVQQALVTHCETMRYRMALLDPPPSDDFGEIQVWRQQFDSKYAALYFPWIVVLDPLQTATQPVRSIPPSGHVTGIFARTDLTQGVQQAPANQPVYWAQDLAVDVNGARQGILNPLGINCFRSFPGRGLLLYGARTVSSDALWRYVNVRRLMMMIEESIEDAVQWAVFEPNDFQLQQALTRTIAGFLETLWQRGALPGTTAADAFYVTCDASNNPPELAAAGQLLAEVGVAVSAPSEFLIFRIGRTEDSLGVTE